jgi:co-chaperonin GroES (HSP10)
MNTERKFYGDPHRIRRNQLKALHNHIIVYDMSFDQRITQSGLILPGDNGTGEGIRPRWGRVYAVGQDQHDVQVGQWVLVSHGRWTRGLNIEDENGKKTIRRIDPNDILMVSDESEQPSLEGVSTSVHVPKQA